MAKLGADVAYLFHWTGSTNRFQTASLKSSLNRLNGLLEPVEGFQNHNFETSFRKPNLEFLFEPVPDRIIETSLKPS